MQAKEGVTKAQKRNAGCIISMTTEKLHRQEIKNTAGNKSLLARSILLERSSLPRVAVYPVIRDCSNARKTITVAPAMNLSSSVKYPKRGSMLVVAKMNAIIVSTEVADNPSCVPNCVASTQKTDQDMTTIRLTGRMIFQN